MGTSSLVHFQENGETICTVYQAYDGYPQGVGKQIFDLLNEVALVTGIPSVNGPYANGVGCLAAQYIAQNKTQAGNIYIRAPDSSDCIDCMEEYNYFVNVDDVDFDKFKVTITVKSSAKKNQFSGTVKKFGKWIGNPFES